jgi:hypothetical protein
MLDFFESNKTIDDKKLILAKFEKREELVSRNYMFDNKLNKFK